MVVLGMKSFIKQDPADARGVTHYRIQDSRGNIMFYGDVDFLPKENSPYGREANEVSGPSFKFFDSESLRIFALNLLRAADKLDGI